MDSKWGFPIIDFHCHFPVPDPFNEHADAAYIARWGREKFDKLRADWRWYQEQWWDNFAFPYPEDESLRTPEEQRERWRAELDATGVERVVFTTGGGNAVLESALKGEDRMLGFAHHDPFAPGAADELRRAVTEGGLRGYKLIAPSLAGPIDHEDLYPVWQVAEDLQIPVLIHFGPLDGGGGITNHVNINPLILHDVAKAFCYTDFVIPHFGCGYPGELLQLMWACRNVSVDSSGNNEWVRWMPYSVTVPDLFRRFYETVGASRIVFGSDSCSFPRGLARKYYDEQTRAVAEMGIPAAERAEIFHDNAARMLKL